MKVEMYSLVILVSALNFLFAMALKQSALIKQVQAVPGGSSPGKSIECAFKLMKAGQVAAKILGGTDSCELLHFSQLTGFESGNEYIEKTTKFDYHTPPSESYGADNQTNYRYWKEQVLGFHHPFGIIFKDPGTTFMLSFQDQSTRLTLNDKSNGITGVEEVTSSYPFSDFKEYKIVFEVLEPRWQIYIDDVAFTTFEHRQPFSEIKKIQVKIGYEVTYLTTAFDPRLQE